MTSGKRHTRFTLLKPIRTENEMGEPLVTYQAFGAVWGALHDSTSREVYRARQTVAQATHVITTPFVRNITTDCQMSFKVPGGTKTLNILGVVDVENRHRELQITAAETTSG